jgi:RluA family pseudouridine synthase
VAKPDQIELPTGERIPILYEDRSVLAIDKPRKWMLAPGTWQKTKWNLQLAISSSVQAGDFWARSRNLKFLRHVHRLDAETTGILLFAKSQGGVRTYGDLFEKRAMEKTYLVVIPGVPTQDHWVRHDKIGPEPENWGRMKVDPQNGKEATTEFRLLSQRSGRALLEARPLTGRTHQIRIHLAASKLPVLGDDLYATAKKDDFPLALRAVQLSYRDPFTRARVAIQASVVEFLKLYGFEPEELDLFLKPRPERATTANHQNAEPLSNGPSRK